MKLDRLSGVDLARYLAFIGMVIVNFKIAMGAETGSGLLFVLTTALEGKAAATFVVLAGIGLGFAAQTHQHGGVLSVTLKRAAFLLAVGLLNTLIFDADILHYYAFYFLFGTLFLTATKRVLVTSILLLNGAFIAMLFAFNYDAGWNWDTYVYLDFWTLHGFARNLFFNGWHPVIPWLGFLLFGLLLSRIALSHRRTQIFLVGAGIAAIGMAELASSKLQTAWSGMPELADLATTAPIPPTPLYFLAGIGAACIVIGMCLLAAETLERIGVLNVLAPAGRQTLTLYIAHILIGMGTLEELDMLGSQSLEASLAASIVFCIAATLYAWGWSRKFKRGPVEALMRKVAG